MSSQRNYPKGIAKSIRQQKALIKKQYTDKNASQKQQEYNKKQIKEEYSKLYKKFEGSRIKR